MRTTLFITFLLACFLIGCSHSGDVSTFIVTEVTKCGGHTKTNTGFLKVEARWKLQRDKNGFQATLTGVSFADMDALMRQAFGVPSMAGVSTGTQTGLPYSNWAARDIGVAIMMIGHADRVEIICLRGVKNMGELFRGGQQ
jgi:hypothetical protein